MAPVTAAAAKPVDAVFKKSRLDACVRLECVILRLSRLVDVFAANIQI
jgi:hypothetical protein